MRVSLVLVVAVAFSVLASCGGTDQVLGEDVEALYGSPTLGLNNGPHVGPHPPGCISCPFNLVDPDMRAVVTPEAAPEGGGLPSGQSGGEAGGPRHPGCISCPPDEVDTEVVTAPVEDLVRGNVDPNGDGEVGSYGVGPHHPGCLTCPFEEIDEEEVTAPPDVSELPDLAGSNDGISGRDGHHPSPPGCLTCPFEEVGPDVLVQLPAHR